MRLLMLAFALLPGAALAGDRDPPGAKCRTQPHIAANPAPTRLQKLGEQPKAEAFYPVLRTEDGCEKLVKVRDYKRRQRGG